MHRFILPHTSVPCSDLVLGWVPQAPTAPDFRMSPKHSCGKITAGTDSYCALCYVKMEMQPAATHLSSTRRHWHLSQAHFAFNLWVFSSFCLHFYTDNARSLTVVVWAWAASDGWHCWCVTAPITAYMTHVALPSPTDEWEFLMASSEISFF